MQPTRAGPAPQPAQPTSSPLSSSSSARRTSRGEAWRALWSPSAPACLPGRQAARWSGAGLGRQVGRVLASGKFFHFFLFSVFFILFCHCFQIQNNFIQCQNTLRYFMLPLWTIPKVHKTFQSIWKYIHYILWIYPQIQIDYWFKFRDQIIP